jgi:hypothetical protein
MLKRKENEILLIAQEECAEVIHAISKVFRFGMDERYEDETNRARLEEEIGDVACLIQLMIQEGLVDEKRIEACAKNKLDRLKIWSTIFKEEV